MQTRKLHNILNIPFGCLLCGAKYLLAECSKCILLQCTELTQWLLVYRFIVSIWAFKHIVCDVFSKYYLPELCIVHGNMNTTAAIQVNKSARKLTIRSIGGNKLIPICRSIRKMVVTLPKNSSVSHFIFHYVHGNGTKNNRDRQWYKDFDYVTIIIYAAIYK